MDQNSIADFVKGFCPEIKKYEAYYYGYPEIADELCELVLTGEKRATTSLLKLYELEQEPLPCAGDYSVILDSTQRPRCITRITKVTPVSYTHLDVYKRQGNVRGAGQLGIQTEGEERLR